VSLICTLARDWNFQHAKQKSGLQDKSTVVRRVHVVGRAEEICRRTIRIVRINHRSRKLSKRLPVGTPPFPCWSAHGDA
jgi:hypothetical protein